MSVIAITTPFNIDLEFKIATFGRRLGAAVIDILILVLYWFAYDNLIRQNINSESVRLLASIFLLGLPSMFYHFLLELFSKGRSVGKAVLKIRVVDMKGNEPSISQYLIRNMFRGLPLILVLYVLLIEVTGDNGVLFSLVVFGCTAAAFIIYVSSKLGQRLGDRIAGTIVIDYSARANIHDTIYLEIEETNYQARYPEVMRLTDRDINGIRNLLDARISTDNDIYMSQVAYRIKEVLNIQSDLDSRSFLQQLLKDYNYLTQSK